MIITNYINKIYYFVSRYRAFHQMNIQMILVPIYYNLSSFLYNNKQIRFTLQKRVSKYFLM